MTPAPDRLRFIGTGGAFYPELGSTAAFFSLGDDLYLLDCGETAFFAMWRARLFDRYPGEITVAVTHLHADHVGSLATLALYAAQVLGRRLTLVHPDARIRTLLALMGVDAARYHLAERLETPRVTLSPRPTRHVPGMSAFSYTVTADGTAFYYSGDTGELPEDVLDDLRAGRLTRAYQDAARADAPVQSPPHMPLSALARRVPEALRGKFTLMHLNRETRAEAERLGFACARVDPIFSDI